MNKLITGFTAMLLMAMTSESCKVIHNITHKKSAPKADSTQSIVLNQTAVKDNQVVVLKDSYYVAKPLGNNAAPTYPAIESTPERPVSKEKLAVINNAMPLWRYRTTYNTFSGKAKVHFEGNGEKQDCVANIRMEKGKKIWISLVFFGIVEGARIYITPDTISMINRKDKTATVLPFSQAGKLLPLAVDFTTLQNLLIGDVLPTPAQPNDEMVLAEDVTLIASTKDYRQSVSLNKADSTLRKQKLEAGTATSIDIIYSDYDRVEGRRFANRREINLMNKLVPYLVNMEFNSAEFDTNLDFNFSIPSKYTRK